MTLHRSISTVEAPFVDVFAGDISDNIDWLQLPEDLKKYERETKALIKAFDLVPMVLSHDTILCIAQDVRKCHNDILLACDCSELTDNYKPQVEINLRWLDCQNEHVEQLSIEW